ncbi:MAG: heavy-metal-associated domain-containing protein [Propionibacteriaceae bacterium]|nr:heavy-metal-associated domain-containing protein [Propionibacteriaceae bacterium]
METSYLVGGMSCENCVKHVLQEVRQVVGVTDGSLDLSGRLVLISEQVLDFSLVSAAVAEAGHYTLTAEAE